MIIYVVQGEAADPDTEQPKNQSEQNEVCITAWIHYAALFQKVLEILNKSRSHLASDHKHNCNDETFGLTYLREDILRELLKKPEVKMQVHFSIQLTAPCVPVSFQSLLPTNKKL